MGLLGHAGALLALELVVPTVVLVSAARARRRRDSYILVAAAVAVFVAVSPPVRSIAHGSVTGHMVQHLVLILVAAPLIGAALAGAPSRLRGVTALRRLSAIAVLPANAALVAGAVHVAVVIAWHHPVVYDAAVDRWVVHGLEHMLLLGTGAWWWSTVFHHGARSSMFAPGLSLFGVATLCAALGVLMMFAPAPLYAHGGIEDQQLAGSLMAGTTGAVYMGTALVLFTAMIRRLAAPRRSRIPAEHTTPIAAAVVIAGAVVMLGVHAQSDETSALVEPSVAEPDIGQELYRRDCAACHGAAGEGTFLGVSIVDVGEAGVYFTLSTGRMPIADPGAEIRRREPAYTPDQIDAIVEYTSTFVDGPEIPELDVAAADLARGGEQYRLHCAACHSATGIGGAQAFGREAPHVLDSTVTETAAAIVAGPGGMPAFRAAFTDDDIAGIAAYVELLQDPPTTGIPIWSGRVGEGLVAWVVGVGMLLITITWVGSRVGPRNGRPT